ncbi:hypothetical protein DL765_004083 [Monosporascus sp. GIB2]|nr:hypothetical protein DL765_004083 [Monosporascus sp. GIB2]
MATKILATWALALRYTNLTQSVHDIAVKSIANWAGCAIGGYGQPAPGRVLDAMSPFIPTENANSTILGTDVVVDVQTAALINGVASHADDYDDTHRDNPIHPSGPVLSALLALAEWKAPISGQDFMTAFVVGVEAECKLGVSVFPEHYNVGWHITSTVGSIGAAVAAGRLLGLDTVQMQRAISMAAIQVTGMHDSFGTDAKPFHVGRAAQNGLMAALLAEKSVTASLEGIEAERGWVNVVSTRENVTAGFSTLGDVWEIELNTFKPFPCDRIIHAAIDGWIQLRTKAIDHGLDISSIVNVTARVHPRVLFLTDNPEPNTGLEAKFSLYHAAAIALLYGEATPSQFTDEAAQDEAVVDLRSKVHATSDGTVEEHEAFVAAEFKNGDTVEIHVEHVTGSWENPLTTEQLKAKFIDQTSTIMGNDRAEKAWSAYWNIANATDISKVIRSY